MRVGSTTLLQTRRRAEMNRRRPTSRASIGTELLLRSARGSTAATFRVRATVKRSTRCCLMGKSDSIYLFALDTYGYTLFSWDPYSQWSGVSELEGTVEDHDVVSVADAFGDSFLYYTKRNPSTGMEERKVTFVKRIVSFGLPILIGAGYYLDEGS